VQYWFFYPFNDYTSNHEETGNTSTSSSTIGAIRFRASTTAFTAGACACAGEYFPEIEDGTHPVAMSVEGV
jgi:hypothetical protein